MSTPDTPAPTTVTDLPVSQIDPGTNDRRTFDPAKLAELAESIRQNGLAQPITVRPLAQGHAYQIVAGERRFRAVRDVLGWPTIPAIVRVLDDATASPSCWRRTSTASTSTPSKKRKLSMCASSHLGWTEQQVADAVGISLELVRRRLSLLALVPDAQFLVAKGHLPIGHAECLVRLDVNRQRIALRTLNDSARLPTLAVWRSLHLPAAGRAGAGCHVRPRRLLHRSLCPARGSPPPRQARRGGCACAHTTCRPSP